MTTLYNCPRCTGETEVGDRPNTINCHFCGLTNYPVRPPMTLDQIQAERRRICGEPNLPLPAFMGQLARKVGGTVEGNPGYISISIQVGQHRYLTVSPDQVNNTGCWLVVFLDDKGDFVIDQHDHTKNYQHTFIPNDCRDMDRLITWINGLKAAYEAPLDPNQIQDGNRGYCHQSRWLS